MSCLKALVGKLGCVSYSSMESRSVDLISRTLHALVEASPDLFGTTTKQGIKQAERSVEVVGEIVSNGSLSAANAAMDVASRKVCW